MSAVLQPTAPAQAASEGTARALRFLTAGSVDDGKSTLIGRLLFDSRAILADQLDTLETTRRRRADRPVAADRRPGGRARTGHHDRRRLPLLRHPHAQVHHRRRAGPRAVHPQHGHGRRRQRRRGGAGRHHQARLAAPPVALLPQTRRHALLAHLLRVPSIVFAVNKLDAVGEPRRRLRGRARRAAGLRRRGRHRGRRRSCRCRRCAATTSRSRRPANGATGTSARSLLQLLEALPAAEGAHDGPAGIAGAVRRAKDRRRHRPPAAHAVGPHRPGQRAGRRRGAGVPERRARQVVAVRRAGEHVAQRRGRPVGRPGARPPARRVARRLDRRTRHAAPRRSASAPRWPGWTPSRPRSAASTGAPRQPLGAGAHRRHRPPARHPHAGSPPTRTSWPSTRSATWSSRLQQPLPLQRYADNRVGGALIVVDPASNRTSGALLVERSQRVMGRVVFIGAGPGAADLITVRGAQRLAAGRGGAVRCPHRPGAARTRAAGALDRRRQARLLRLPPRQAAINALLVRHARSMATRSCGSRAATRACSAASKKNSQALAEAGIACEVVPGVTAALAAAAATQRPLTRRGSGRSVSLTHRDDARAANLHATRSADTEVFYMAGRQLGALARAAARRRLAGRHAGGRGLARRLARPAGQRPPPCRHWPRPRCCTPGGRRW